MVSGESSLSKVFLPLMECTVFNIYVCTSQYYMSQGSRLYEGYCFIVLIDVHGKLSTKTVPRSLLHVEAIFYFYKLFIYKVSFVGIIN